MGWYGCHMQSFSLCLPKAKKNEPPLCIFPWKGKRIAPIAQGVTFPGAYHKSQLLNFLFLSVEGSRNNRATWRMFKAEMKIWICRCDSSPLTQQYLRCGENPTSQLLYQESDCPLCQETDIQIHLACNGSSCMGLLMVYVYNLHEKSSLFLLIYWNCQNSQGFCCCEETA